MIKSGPFAGGRHELRYCAYCSKDLCDKCLAEGTCRETPKGDGRHRVEDDCPDCGGSGQIRQHHGPDDNYDAVDCTTCEGSGTAVVPVTWLTQEDSP